MSTERGLHGADGVTLVGLGRASPAASEAAPAVLSVEREGGEASLTTYRLERRRYVIGRNERCDVRIEDRDLSREHAALERDEAGRWCIVDLGSSSGTLVNGRRLEAGRPRPLGPGDVVHAGTWRLRVRSGKPPAPSALLLPPDGQHKRPNPARIRVYDGVFADRELRLDRGEVVISADEDATVSLDPARNAGIRVIIRPRADGAFDVRDESEAESLSVNGRPLAAYKLGRSDVVLRIGPMEVQRRSAHEAFTVRYLPSERRPGQETPPMDAGEQGEASLAAEPLGGERATRPLRMLSLGNEALPPDPWGHDTAPLRGSVQHTTAPFPTVPAPAWLADDTLPAAPPEAALRAADSVPTPPAEAVDERAPAQTLEAVEPVEETVSARPEPGAHGAASPHTAAHDTERLATLPFDPLQMEEGVATTPDEPNGGESVPHAVTGAGEGVKESLRTPTVRLTSDPGIEQRAEPPAGMASGAQAALPRRVTPLALVGAALLALVGLLAALFGWSTPEQPTPPAATSALAALSTNGPPQPPHPFEPPSAATDALPAPRLPEVPSALRPSSVAPSATPRTVTPSRPPQRTAAVPTGAQDDARERDATEDAHEALRRRLEAKAKTGRATTGELQTLLTLCLGLRDATCVAQTRAQLATKEAP